MKSENGVGEKTMSRSISNRPSIQELEHRAREAVLGPKTTREHQRLQTGAEQHRWYAADGDFPYWIQEDDFYVTIDIQTESIAGAFLFLSISARSVVLFAAPNKPEIHDDDDVPRMAIRPIEYGSPTANRAGSRKRSTP